MSRIQIGDFIRAYHKGYHRVTAVEPRSRRQHQTDSPLIYYTAVLDSNGKRCAARKYCCDELYCAVVTRERADQIITYNLEVFEELKSNLLKGINGEI